MPRVVNDYQVFGRDADVPHIGLENHTVSKDVVGTKERMPLTAGPTSAS